MESITRNDAKVLSQEVLEALQEVARDHGLTVEVRGGTYDAGSFKPRVEFKTAGSDEQLYNMYRDVYDLPEFGTTFKSQGKTFKISGFAPRSPKRPVLATDEAGKVWKLTDDGLRHACLRREQSPAPEDAEDTYAPENLHQDGEKVWELRVDGEVVKTSKSKASLQSYRSRTKCGGEIV